MMDGIERCFTEGQIVGAQSVNAIEFYGQA